MSLVVIVQTPLHHLLKHRNQMKKVKEILGERKGGTLQRYSVEGLIMFYVFRSNDSK